MVCPHCGAKVEGQTSSSRGVSKGAVPAHSPKPQQSVTLKYIQTLWGDSIRADMTPGMSIKQKSKDTEIPSYITVKKKSLASAKEKIEPTADYELLELLGKGGMGVVYSARQTSIDRTIAVKMIKDKLARDEDVRGKFLSEAAVTGDLDHPNIVPIHDLGETEKGYLFYAMKQVKGTPWKDVIQQKLLTENLEILLRVADAVAFAHSRGVIHRDLKPENVMLGDFGEVLVMDWGLAAAVTDKGKAEDITKTAAIGGTPAYMGPEMATGDVAKIGTTSDVYLLGGILYEIVTGKKPHSGETVTQCLLNAAQNVIQTTDKSGELIDIALKAMATRPQERYPGVKEFQGAIRQCQEHFQSITMARQAQEDLQRAETSKHYDDYSQALFGFQQALELWEGNDTATKNLTEAKLAYATCAFENGDLDLAASLLEAEEPIHRKLAQQVESARKKRAARQSRLKILTYGSAGLAGVIIIILTVAFFWIRSEQKQTAQAERAARHERDRAVEEERRAKAALAESAANEATAYCHLGQYDSAVNACIKGREALEMQHLRMLQWHAERGRGQPAFTLQSQGGAVRSVAFSPDGRLLAAASSSFQQAAQGRKNEIKLWDVKARKEIRAFSDESCNNIFCLAFSPDSKLLALVDYNVIKVWDVGKGEERITIGEGAGGSFQSVAFSHDGRLLASATKAHDATTNTWYVKIMLWSVETGVLARTMSLRGRANQVASLAFSPDGRLLATGSWDTIIKLWSMEAGKGDSTLRGHRGHVNSIAFSPDGKILVSGSSDFTVRLWDVDSAREITTLKGHANRVHAVAFSPDGKFVASGSLDRLIKIWEVGSGKEVMTLRGHASVITSLAFSPDGKLLASGSCDKTTKIWNTQTGTDTVTVSLFDRSKLDTVDMGHPAMALSPDGKLLARTVDSSHLMRRPFGPEIELQKLESGEEKSFLRGHHGYIYTIEFSRDGKLLASGATDKTIRVWDLPSGRERFTLRGHERPVNGIGFSPDGKRLASGSFDGTVRLWDIGTGREISTLKGHRNYVRCVAFSPDGKVLASGSCDTTVRLWDVRTGRELAVLEGHAAEIRLVAFSPDGKTLTSASWDTTIKLWDVAAKQEKATLSGHGARVMWIAFRRDGRLLASGAYDGTVKFWDVESGEELMTLYGHTWPLAFIEFSPDGKKLVSGTAINLKIWDVDPSHNAELRRGQHAP